MSIVNKTVNEDVLESLKLDPKDINTVKMLALRTNDQVAEQVITQAKEGVMLHNNLHDQFAKANELYEETSLQNTKLFSSAFYADLKTIPNSIDSAQTTCTLDQVTGKTFSSTTCYSKLSDVQKLLNDHKSDIQNLVKNRSKLADLKCDQSSSFSLSTSVTNSLNKWLNSGDIIYFNLSDSISNISSKKRDLENGLNNYCSATSNAYLSLRNSSKELEKIDFVKLNQSLTNYKDTTIANQNSLNSITNLIFSPLTSPSVFSAKTLKDNVSELKTIYTSLLDKSRYRQLYSHYTIANHSGLKLLAEDWSLANSNSYPGLADLINNDITSNKSGLSFYQKVSALWNNNYSRGWKSLSAVNVQFSLVNDEVSTRYRSALNKIKKLNSDGKTFQDKLLTLNKKGEKVSPDDVKKFKKDTLSTKNKVLKVFNTLNKNMDKIGNTIQEELTNLQGLQMLDKSKEIISGFNSIFKEFGNEAAFRMLVTKPAQEDAEYQRDRNAKLLEDSIYHALLRENYPDIRDEDIEAIIGKFYTPAGQSECQETADKKDTCDIVDVQYRRIWEITTMPGRKQAEPLVLDLKEALRENRYLKKIIDESVNKRLELFRTDSGSQAKNDTQNLLTNFVESNLKSDDPTIDTVLAASVTGYEDSLFTAFFKAYEGNYISAEGNARDRKAIIRKAIISSLKNDRDLETAMRQAMIHNPRLLKLSGTGTDQKTTAWQQKIKNKISKDSSYKNLESSSSKLYKTSLKYDQEKINLNNKFEDYKNALVTAYSYINHSDTEASIDAAAEINNELDELSKNMFVGHSIDIKDNIEYKLVVSWAYEIIKQLKTYDKTKEKELKDAVSALNSSLKDVKSITEVKKHTEINLDTNNKNNIKNKNSEKLKGLANKIKDASNKVETNLSSVKAKLTEFSVWLLSQPGNWGNLTNAQKKNVEEYAKKIKKEKIDETIGDYSSPIKKLKENSSFWTTFEQTFSNVVTQHKAYTVKIEEVSAHKEVLDNQKRAFSAQKKVFLEQVKKSVNVLNVEGVQDTYRLENKELGPFIDAFSAKFNDKLNSFFDKPIDDAKYISNSFDESVSFGFRLGKYADVFAKTFKGFSELAGSDEPVLSAILKSDKVKFGNLDLAANSIDILNKKLKLSLKSSGKTWGGVKAKIDTTFKEQIISYLFSQPNSKVIYAFKNEFYNRFKDKNILKKALQAEREAGYDYWWLTFYPKAIPLGDHRLEGQSIIEVGFNESIIPEEQYHRWLQDNLLFPTINDLSSQEEQKYSRRIRIATSVVNDFMTVLDSSHLNDKYSDIRATLNQAVDKFIKRDQKAKERFKNGVGFLHKLALKKEKSMYKTLKNESYKEQIDAMKTRSHYDCFIAKLENDYKHPKHDTYEAIKGFQEINFKNKKEIKRNVEEQLDGNLDFNKDKIYGLIKQAINLTTINKASTTEKDVQDFDELRNLLALDHFDVRQVFYAVISATSSGMALPQKVELYTNAYFDGVKRFSNTLNINENRALEEKYLTEEAKKVIGGVEKYLVPFGDTQYRSNLRRYLILNGIDHKGVQTLSNYFNCMLYDGESCNLINNNKTTRKIYDLTNVLKNKDSITLSNDNNKWLYDYFKVYAGLTYKLKRKFNRIFFKGIKYKKGIKPNPYLKYPDLWLWEQRLDQARESLREIIINKYYTSYPGIPDLEKVKSEFLAKPGHLEAIIYHWLRKMWIYIEKNHLLDKTGNYKVKAAKVFIQLSIDKHPYLTPDSQSYLIKSLTKSGSIYDWIESIREKQSVMDQLYGHLLDYLYRPLFVSLAKLVPDRKAGHGIPVNDLRTF